MRQAFALSSLALPFKRANASAAEPGALVYDPAVAAPAVSRAGAFRRLAVLVDVPATAASAGNAGDYAVGGGYLYVCTGPSTWQRVATATW